MASEASSPELVIHTLGRFDIRQSGQRVVGLKLRKARALLIYLLLNPGPHDRSRLAGLLWGDCTEKKARHNLRQTLWRLRQALPPHLLTESRHQVGLTLSTDIWVDAMAMQDAMRQAERCHQRGDVRGRQEHLNHVAALYRGEFLADLSMDDCPEFSTWRAGYAAALHHQALTAMTQLAQQAFKQGQYAQALDYTRDLLQLEPWWEEGHRLMMTLLALTGQRSAALAQYRRCRQQLLDEVGVEPMPETTALYHRLLRWKETPWDKDTAVAEKTLMLPLTGREQEHAQLVAWWEKSVQRGSQLILVAGEAGVGKTRLVEEVIRYARMQGAVILRGRCYEFGSELPYQPIADALRGFLRATPAAMPALSTTWLTALARLLPELREQHPHLPAPPAQEQLAVRQHLFEGVAQFLRALTQSHDDLLSRPLLFFLDDLHWADASSLDLLHYLLRNLADVPIGLVGTYRPEETTLTHPLTRLRQGLSRDHLVTRISLAPLDSDAVLQLTQKLLNTRHCEALAQILYRESEGNPFFLIETLYTLDEQGLLNPDVRATDWQAFLAHVNTPGSVQDVILQRVGRLTPSARELLTLAAVIGRHFNAQLLQKAADEQPAVINACLVLWQQRHLMRSHPTAAGCYDFQHDKIRKVVYESIPLAQRRQLHARVGQALEQDADSQQNSHLLAWHWRQAGYARKAVPYLLQAGDQARLLYARQEAVTFYRQALELLQALGEDEQAARTLMKLGITHHHAFEFEQARTAYDQAFHLWQQGARKPAGQRPPASRPLRIRWLEPDVLDPALATDVHTNCLMAHLFSGLVALAPDMSIVPDVARSWEVLEHGRVFRFHLRPDVRWRDGVPVTAYDFEYAWKRALDPALDAHGAAFLFDLQGARAFHLGQGPREAVGVRAVDALTLLVSLTHPAGYFLQLLAHAIWRPVPRHVVERLGASWMQAMPLIGNGPFVLDTWERGKCMVLARNPHFHGQFSGNLQQILLYPIQSWEERLYLYQQGELDVLSIANLDSQARELLLRRRAGEHIARLQLDTHFLAFDVTRPPFDELAMRRAFALAISRQALADEVLQGFAAPATGGLLPPGMPGHVPDLAPPYHPQEARRLLAAQGYAGRGHLPTVTMLAYDAVAERVQFLQAAWQDVLGITVQVDVVPWREFLQRLHQPYHLVNLGWRADYPDPDNFLRVGRNRAWSKWQHAGYERLIQEARGLTDLEARMAHYHRAQEILAAALPILPLIYEQEHLLIQPWVQRYPMSGIQPAHWADVVL
jgi:ABC-type oligopeptide transport system substrate-binding subunit/DNA-binding SARP family transcriptional activator